MSRCDALIVLEILPLAPVSHGAGNNGNEQRIATLDLVMPDGTVETTPHVSGAALKACLREAAVLDYAEAIGAADGSISMDRLRLLLKGGRNDSGGASMSIAEMRRMVDLAPLLGVFGAMDGGFPLPGRLSVGAVLPYTDVTVEARAVDPEIALPQIADDAVAPGIVRASDGGAAIVPWAGRDPIAHSDVVGRVQRYSHDLESSDARHLVALEDRERKDEATALVRASARPNAAARRAAVESMPYSAQVIRAGTPLVARLRLRQVSEVEVVVFLRALARWRAAGAFLGGMRREGFGECQVRVLGISSPWSSSQSVSAGERVLDEAIDGGAVYVAHLRARLPEILAWVQEDKGGTKATKPKKSAKAAAAEVAP